MNFEEIIKNGSYTDFKDYCEENDFIIKESVEDNSYVFSVTKKGDSDVLINGIVTKDKIELYITDESGEKMLDQVSEEYADSEELFSYLKGALVTSGLLSGETSFIDDQEILNEDSEGADEYTTIPGGLAEIEEKVQGIGDSLKKLSDLSNSLDMKAIIMDLANSAYGFAIEIRDSIDSYNEIMEIPEEDEELEPDVEDEE